jgi:alkylhydroperoxidase/carboxymuconolactone decarboxylase family protein YurZ
MARPEEVKSVKAFRAAKTGDEMIRSWASQTPGRNTDGLVEAMRYVSEQRPELIKHYAQDPLADLMDRGILDRKTREMIMIGVLMERRDQLGVTAHVENALAGGVTEKELQEVAAIVIYEAGKCALAAMVMLDQALKTAKKDGVTLYKP